MQGDIVKVLGVLKNDNLASADFHGAVNIWNFNNTCINNETIETPITFTQFPITDIFAYGPQYSDDMLPDANDISYGPIKLDNAFSLADTSFKNIYISTNGYLTFSFLDEFTPFLSNNLNVSIIAPLFNDFDSKIHGHVYYREAADSSTLNNISTLIKTLFKQTPADLALNTSFIVTWSSLPIYDQTSTSNTFQLVLASYDSCYSYVLFLYKSLSSQSESDFMSGYFESKIINGKVPNSIIKEVIDCGCPIGYAFKIQPAAHCSISNSISTTKTSTSTRLE